MILHIAFMFTIYHTSINNARYAHTHHTYFYFRLRIIQFYKQSLCPSLLSSYFTKIPRYQVTMFQLHLNENTLLGKSDATVELNQQLRNSTLRPISNRMRNKTKSCSDLLDLTSPLPGTPTSSDTPTWSRVPDVIKSSSQTTALDLPMRANATKVSSGR